ncbi:MBOAT family protein [soil metagenome]
MLFNSIEFLGFFVIVTFVFYALPHKYRWFHLLAASCYFYMAFVPVYILILFGTIIIDYIAGRVIENAEGSKRKLFLIISLAANIGILAFFKYYNFFVDNITIGLHALHADVKLPFLKMLLPIGLSFHTFQAMSYTIEIYRGNTKAEKHFGIYALYIMFYPQLVAGPIERPQQMLFQLHERQTFDQNNLFIGIKMMLWGFFKKVVIADRLGVLVNHVYASPASFNSTMLLVAVVFFSLQLYCDFSGYSTIARGAGRTMGYELIENFRTPFNSVTISEFWTRWHISLSSWFKDYVFFPIASAKRYWGLWGTIYAVLITYILSGLWHGAGWGYILWGALTGFLIVCEIALNIKQSKIRKSRIKKIIGILYVFIAFSLIGIFFRAHSIPDAVLIYKRLFSSNWGGLQDEQIFSKFSYLLSFLFIGVLFYAENRFINKVIQYKIEENYKRNITYGVVVLSLILVFGVFQNLSFIYFQF